MRKLVSMTLLFLSFSVMGDVLLWMVDNSSYVDDIPMDLFVSELPDDYDNWAVVRVKITTGAGVVKYLDITDPGGDINLPGTTYNGFQGVYLGGNGEFYGTGGEVQGVLSSDVDIAVTFAIELGINHWIDDGTEEGRINFELLAITDEHTYEQLQDFMYQQHDINPLDLQAWNPTYYHSVPEPSISILFMIGFNVLALRRKNR